MKPKVINLTFAKEFKELGVKQESLWWWCDQVGRGFRVAKIYNSPDIGLHNLKSYAFYSAFTAAELLVSLPQHFGGMPIYALTCVKLVEGWWVGYMDEDGCNHPDGEAFDADTLESALSILKIWLIRNKKIKC